MAAVRELAEEAALTIADPAELVKFSRWITPAEVAIRFDTHFFLVALPAGQEPRVDGEECVDLRWLTPREALDTARGRPARPRLPDDQDARAARALRLGRRGRSTTPAGATWCPSQPRVVVTGEIARVLLPGEPGYDD